MLAVFFPKVGKRGDFWGCGLRIGEREMRNFDEVVVFADSESVGLLAELRTLDNTVAVEGID